MSDSHKLSLDDLPDEVYLQLLRYLCFEDYVALTQVNLQLRLVLEAPIFLDYIYEQCFGGYMDAYCHYPKTFSKVIPHKVYQLVAAFENPTISINCSETSREMKLLKHPDAYFAVVDCLKRQELRLKQQMKHFMADKRIYLSSYILLKKIFDLHNYSIANWHFELCGDQLSEESFLQLSRYSADFYHHAASRQTILRHIYRALDNSGLPQNTRRLNFPDMKGYEHFLKYFCSLVLRHLPAGSTDKQWTTISAFYAGKSCGDQNGLDMIYTLHLLLKVLKENLFNRYQLFVGEKSLNCLPVVKNHMILIDQYAIFVNHRSIKLVNSRQLQNLGILRNGMDFNTIFSEEFFNHEIRIHGINPMVSWNELPSNTMTFEKVRSLCSLHQMNIEEMNKMKGFGPCQAKSTKGVPLLFKQGQLVTSEFQDLIGIVLEDTSFDSPVIDVQGIDSGEAKQFKIGDFRQIGPGDVSINDTTLEYFLTWLIRSDLFVQYVGITHTHLLLEDGYFRLLPFGSELNFVMK